MAALELVRMRFPSRPAMTTGQGVAMMALEFVRMGLPATANFLSAGVVRSGRLAWRP